MTRLEALEQLLAAAVALRQAEYDNGQGAADPDGDLVDVAYVVFCDAVDAAETA